MTKSLISLVSEQTIPNVELIKEFKNNLKCLLFVTTDQMEKRGQVDWIIKAAGVSDLPVERIVVDPFDPKDIEKKLRDHSFGETDEFIVNITGGTKLMSLIANSVFRDLGARIYYVTGQDKTYLKIYPVIGKDTFEMRHKVLLDEYLTAYGFGIKKSAQACPYNQSYLLEFYGKYKEGDKSVFDNISLLRKYRNKKSIRLGDDPEVQVLIDYFELPLIEPGKLFKTEIRFLTGDWFEWLIYNKVKNELELESSDIGIGYEITKEGVLNEMDVMFVYNNKLYTIECKTGITMTVKDAEGKERRQNLLADIIYKSDSLQKRLGLFVNTSVFTLSKIYQDDGVTPLPNMKDHIERAGQYRIKVCGNREIESEKNIKEILNIY